MAAGSSPEDGPALPPHPERSLPLQESDSGNPRSRWQEGRLLQSSVLSEAQEAQGEQIDLLMEQMKFLEDQVQRLNAELAAYQGGARESPGPDPRGSPHAARPLPPVLQDSGTVTPLMVAYDRRLAEQERLLEERTARAEELSVQMDALVSENEGLLKEVQHCMRVIESKEEGQRGSPPIGRKSDILARLELLSRENDLLVEQQGELEAELSRAQGQLTLTTAENSRLQRERAQLVERAEAVAAALEKGARERGGRQEELRQLAEEYDGVIEQVARLKGEKHAAEEAAAESRRQLKVTQARFHADLSALQAQHNSSQERARASADALAAAARDAESWRGRCASSERELAATRADAEDARRAVGALEARLKEYKLKDATAFQSVKKAKEEAEEARIERTRAQSKLARMEEEVASLSQRLEAQRTELTSKREADLASQATRSAQALSAAQDEGRQLETQCAELRSQLDRALRDKRSGEAEMEQLKAKAVHFVPGKLEDVSKQAAQLAAATARAEEAERARDEALEKVGSLSNAAQRSMTEWERERSQLLAQAADLGRQLQRVEGELDEKLGILQQLEATVEEVGRSNRSLSRSQAKVEKRARDEVQAMRLEKETQVRSLKIKLDEAVAVYERSAQEAESLIASKEHLVNRWREESQQIARSFEAASGEQREEIGRLMARVEDLTNRLQAGQTVIDGQEDEIQVLRQSLQALKPAYEALERRVAELSAQLSLSAAREEQLLAARKELRGQVDQMAVEVARADRGCEAACEELTWQLREAQGAMDSVALSPLQANLPQFFDGRLDQKDARRPGRRRSEKVRESRSTEARASYTSF